ncbi:Protein PXR1 [Cercospora beticola]|uniref:PinX1-related protein 1 n=1 Tax=Cercospora beticola TaxID=122368 RepID=A0A2G5HEW5_CERBT|nr:Protein PXR1 [Cercospora beticola]PIA90762.1 Protein PXR1 [Cercospora beticola]WPB08017.1 hypothetical protein RHO25_012681 [Cercospora beticola]
MGLAGNKKKTKLSADPNNTAWAKSTTSFGHKILSKQGWKPGDYLGAENASHSDHYTAANASHIRVMLREDNLGLGAKIGTQNAETFGLSMFSGLLGRLNGKEEDQVALKKKEETLRDVQLKLKYGNLNFVRGGLLVGDKMCEVKTDLGHLKEGGKKRKASDAENDEDEEAEDSKAAKKRRKQKKRQKATNGTAAAIKEMKRQRRMEAGAEDIPSTTDVPSREAESTSDSTSSSEDEKPSSSSKRSKKSSRKESKRSSEDSNPIDKDEKARLKAEKRQRKEERRKRKEEKRAKRAAKEAKKDSKSSSAVASESEAATTASGTSTPTFLGGRQAVRHRYIMQKRMAAGSAQALKEIFMMKPQVAS